MDAEVNQRMNFDNKNFNNSPKLPRSTAMKGGLERIESHNKVGAIIEGPTQRKRSRQQGL
jgi:hypothetical protein